MFSPHALNTEQQKLRIKSAVIGPSWTEIRITLYLYYGHDVDGHHYGITCIYSNHDKFRPWCYSVSSEKGKKLLYFHLSTL